MTGGDLEYHDIIEIGAVRTSLLDLAVMDELAVKVAPRTMRGANPQSLKIAGYSTQGWKSAVTIDDALHRLETFAAGALLVGWATYNDLLFIRTAAARVGIEGLLGDAYLEVQDWAQE